MPLAPNISDIKHFNKASAPRYIAINELKRDVKCIQSINAHFKSCGVQYNIEACIMQYGQMQEVAVAKILDVNTGPTGDQ